MKFADYPIWARLAAWGLLMLLLAGVLFPFFWMLSTSFKSLEDQLHPLLGQCRGHLLHQ